MKIESWKSNEGSREDHYYKDKTKKVYIGGLNPKVLGKAKSKAIRKILKAK